MDVPEHKTRNPESLSHTLPAVSEAAVFYQSRHRFYTGVVVFVIMVGMPLLVVPPLRHRLLVRIQVLREAAKSSGRPALEAKVGENTTPLPQEFVRPIAPTLPLPQLPNVIYPTSRAYYPQPTAPAPPVGIPKGAVRRGPEPKITRDTATEEPPAPEAERSDSSEPQFRQGKIEQEAYDLLVQSSPNVASLIQGGNPALKFKDWAAAKIEEDVYYVRLTFSRENGEAPYIWQVKLLSKQVTPLNFNARSLPPK